MNYVAVLFCLFGILKTDPIAAQSGSGKPPPIADVVGHVQSFYMQVADLKGNFKQVYTDTLYNRHRTSYGYLYIKKPAMMRWNYLSPEKKSFIADGTALWVWEPEDSQAFRNALNVNTLSTGLNFLLGAGNLKKEFTASYATGQDKELGSPEDLVVKLVPVKPTAQYQYVIIVVRAGDYAVTESIVVSASSKNHFIFTDLKMNTNIARSKFVFVPPPGTRVIDTPRTDTPRTDTPKAIPQ